MSRALRTGFFLLAILLAGCGLDPVRVSDRVSTRDMLLGVTALDDGVAAAIDVQIGSPIGTVELTGGDALFVTVDGTRLPMIEGQSNGAPIHSVKLDALPGDFLLDLERQNDRDVHGVVVEVSRPFTLAAEGLTQDLPLSLSWDADPEGGEVSISVQGDCIDALTRSLDEDTGALVITQAELRPPPAGPPLAPCALEVLVSRTITTRDALFSTNPGGNITTSAEQRRTIAVIWTP
ncbi:hypothetical protein [Polyangium sp. 15x6]|uniref:hypothetical protein n=1 Tax=Polyangium sp. 15x6 TaxID=3042687 RepID=UPI00249B1B3B|nr:hypothetical protein [Polyangium sp. 15x6]MDI3284128.1 hypothetical protein [Polyangium sp. 15x6]